MSEKAEAADLDCSFDDYFKVKGYSSVKELSRDQKTASSLFELVDGGMRLSTVTEKIMAHSTLDTFVVKQFERYQRPGSRQFGENLFTVVGSAGNFRIGHTERYCGSTFRMPLEVFKAKSNGLIVAVAHTHPYFRGFREAKAMNKEGAQFGPGDWTPLVAFKAPMYLYTPLRQTYVMEYDGSFVTVRKVGGKARKWRVSKK